MLKLYIIVYNFCIKTCDLINNFIQHEEKQPYQEVEDSYIFAGIFEKKWSDY